MEKQIVSVKEREKLMPGINIPINLIRMKKQKQK